MKVKVIDESHEKDLESSVNEFLSSTNCDIIDIKYQVAISLFGEEQIYCFSAMIIYVNKEIEINHVIFREHDKVLQLANNPDCNVFNGDIGYIVSIDTVYSPRKSEIVTIDFDGNYVEYKKEDMAQIKHAYAITIHKSQGSEFPHVIIPVSKNYSKMLYNKLIYTGVSRAKKSLVLIGEKEAFEMSVVNDYSTYRKTSLKEFLENNL